MMIPHDLLTVTRLVSAAAEYWLQIGPDGGSLGWLSENPGNLTRQVAVLAVACLSNR